MREQQDNRKRETKKRKTFQTCRQTRRAQTFQSTRSPRHATLRAALRPPRFAPAPQTQWLQTIRQTHSASCAAALPAACSESRPGAPRALRCRTRVRAKTYRSSPPARASAVQRGLLVRRRRARQRASLRGPGTRSTCRCRSPRLASQHCAFSAVDAHQWIHFVFFHLTWSKNVNMPPQSLSKPNFFW